MQIAISVDFWFAICYTAERRTKFTITMIKREFTMKLLYFNIPPLNRYIHPILIIGIALVAPGGTLAGASDDSEWVPLFVGLDPSGLPMQPQSTQQMPTQPQPTQPQQSGARRGSKLPQKQPKTTAPTSQQPMQQQPVQQQIEQPTLQRIKENEKELQELIELVDQLSDPHTKLTLTNESAKAIRKFTEEIMDDVKSIPGISRIARLEASSSTPFMHYNIGQVHIEQVYGYLPKFKIALERVANELKTVIIAKELETGQQSTQEPKGPEVRLQRLIANLKSLSQTTPSKEQYTHLITETEEIFDKFQEVFPRQVDLIKNFEVFSDLKTGEASSDNVKKLKSVLDIFLKATNLQ